MLGGFIPSVFILSYSPMAEHVSDYIFIEFNKNKCHVLGGFLQVYQSLQEVLQTQCLTAAYESKQTIVATDSGRPRGSGEHVSSSELM